MPLYSSSPSLLLLLLLPLLLPVSVVAIPAATPAATTTGDGWNHLPAITAPHITPAPELRKRGTINPLLDGECSQPILHVETINGYFLAPWVGCDQYRPQCCLPGYPAYAFTVGTDQPTAAPSAFRVTACPPNFVKGTLDNQPTDVIGICCPTRYAPLSTFAGDWFDRGPLCARSMDQLDIVEQARSTWPVVMQEMQFWNASSSFHAPLDRFKSRFVAVGYYLNPKATASTPDPVAVPGATTVTVTATHGSDGGSGGSSGSPPAVVAGAAVGGVLLGCLASAAICLLVMARRKRPVPAGPAGGDQGSEGEQEATWPWKGGSVQQTEIDTAHRVEMPATADQSK